MGITTIQVNLTRFATHVLGVSDGDADKPFLILTLVMGLVTVPAARLARRIGVKWVIAGSMVLIAVAAGAALAVQTAGQVVPVFILAGSGNVCLLLTWPLLPLSIPPERVGVFGGLKTTADSAAGFVAAVLVGLWAYRSILLVLLVASVASLAVLVTVHVETSGALAPPATLRDGVITAP